MQSDSKSLGKAKYTGPRGHRKNQIHAPECVNIREKWKESRELSVIADWQKEQAVGQVASDILKG